MMGVTLQWTVFVESANKPLFVNLHQRVITFDLVSIEKSQNTLGKIKIHMVKIMILMIMIVCVHLIILILFNIFYK